VVGISKRCNIIVTSQLSVFEILHMFCDNCFLWMNVPFREVLYFQIGEVLYLSPSYQPTPVFFNLPTMSMILTMWMIAYFLRQCGLPTTLTASSGLRTYAKLFKASWTGSSTTLIRIYICIFTLIDALPTKSSRTQSSISSGLRKGRPKKVLEKAQSPVRARYTRWSLKDWIMRNHLDCPIGIIAIPM